MILNILEVSSEEEAQRTIARSIQQRGWFPEHNADYYIHSTQPESASVIFATSSGELLLTHRYCDEWWLFVEPIASQERRALLIREFCSYALAYPEIKKVVLEITSQTRKALQKTLAPELRSCAIAETLIWPVVDLTTYRLDYGGPQYKSLRNARNRFFREHQVEVRDAHGVSKDELRGIVHQWKRGRRASHKGITESYYGVIDDDFRGTSIARALIVDARAEALNAGWAVPGQPDRLYLALSLHSYAYWGLGEVSTMSTLEELKQAGYRSVDLGGSDRNLLSFKRQFGASPSYKTHRYSIVRAL